jgi:syntaxin 16
MEPDLETRTRELNEIAKSITQLAEVFKDLQTMVIDQGTILDSIEYNIEQTVVHVQEAVKELKVATQYVLVSTYLTLLPNYEI